MGNTFVHLTEHWYDYVHNLVEWAIALYGMYKSTLVLLLFVAWEVK